MKNKLFYGLTLALASASVFGLAACGGKTTTTTNNDGSTTTQNAGVCGGATDLVADVTNLLPKRQVIKLYTDNGEGYSEEIVTAFEKAYPQYILEVETVGATDVRARMELEGADGADVFVFPHDHVGAALSSGLLAKAPTAVADKFDETLKASTLDTIKSCWDDATGKQKQCTGNDVKYTFGAPLSAESNALFYNIELVKEILTDFAATLEGDAKTKYEGIANQLNGTNLAQLMTLEDVMEVSAFYNVVPSAGNTDHQYFYQADFDNFYHSYMYLTPFGFELFGPNGDDKTADNLGSDAVIDALDYVKETFRVGAATPIYPLAIADVVEGTYMDEFYAGTAPIVVTGPWNASTIYEAFAVEGEEGLTYPNLGGCEMFPITVNGVKTPSTTFSGVQVIGVSSLSKVTSAAWDLVQYMVSDEGASILYSNSGKLPCLKDTSNIEGISEDIVLNAVSAQLLNSKGMPSINEMGYVWTIGENLFKEAFQGLDSAEVAAKAHKSFVDQAGLTE